MPTLEDNSQPESKSCGGAGDSNGSDWGEMRAAIERLRAEVRLRDERMEQMAEDMNRMRATAKAIVGGAGSDGDR